MEVAIVDGCGVSCVAFVKGTVHSCMEKQKTLPVYMKMP
jgi:hypothetical protein